MEEYKNQFTTPGSRNWLKGSVAVNVTKRGLAPFACKVCDVIRVEQLTLAIKQHFPDLCENCSIVEVIPCDPNNNICNSGQCRFHKGRIFRPCPIVKCNDYRNTVIDKIHKGIDIGCHCNSCRTTEIVPCNPRNKVCTSSKCRFHMDPNTKQYIPTRPCPNNICGTLRNSIEQKHRFGNPSWKNTDARKWCVNAWDIAKCFMPPDGYAEVDNETDTDLNGIISVYINCEEFQQYFTADLSNRQNICDKVRDVGKNIRHAPGLEVTDDDLNVWLSDLKALFSDPAFSKGNPLAKDALDQLYQLENDELIIERSEDLEMKMEEVLKQNVISGMDSFKSELKDTLIKYHREHNCTLMIGPFVECGNDGLEDFYVPPNISRVILQSREKNKPLKEPLTSLDQLLISKQIIVLTADAGVGKTSFYTHLELSSLKHLSKINIHDSRLTQVTINPTSLEKFWVYVKPELIPEIPPMKVSFVGGSQFSCSLQKLSLVHVTMDVTLDLSNCQNLQNLVIENISNETMIENNVVNNIQHCYALQELNLFTLTFPTDTHLELSSLKHLSKINIHDSRLTQVTINPTSLEKFWIYVKPELIPEIPPMKVSFVGGSQFSGSLQKLSLVHVTMDVTLDLSNCQNLQNLVIENISYETLIGNNVVNNIHRCYALQELRLDTLTFPADTHLDLSSLKHLSKINIQNSRLTHVTINPSSLEKFWVYVKPELIQEIPSMEVSFVGGSQFSGCLQKLSLVHVTMDVTLDLSNCQNLQNLVIGNISYETLIENNVVNNIQRCYALQKLKLYTLTFPADTHLDLSSLKHLSKITIQNSRLSHVTIHPTSLEMFWVYMKPELIPEIPPMKVSFVGGSQFSGCLQKLSLVHITLDVTLDLSDCQNLQTLVIKNISYETLIENNVVNNIQRCYALQELNLFTLTFPADTHLDLSSLKHLSKITIQDSRLTHVTIYPTSLEKLWVYVKPELIPEIPPMKVSFVGGSQFSGCLQELRLEHISLDVTLDLSNCQNLQNLAINNISYEKMIGNNVVNNIQRCFALQELNLDTLTFPAHTHLDLSSLRHLSKITIQDSRLTHVTIYPTSLEMFWVFVKPELIQEIPPMKVSFVGGSQFSGILQKLSLAHVTMDVNLDLSNCQKLQNLVIDDISYETLIENNVVNNIQRCYELQELSLDTLTFSADTHLDLSSLKHLSKINIQNSRLTHVTINPSSLEEFWVYVKPELIQEISSMKVSFVGGSQFSGSLHEISLVHVTMDVTLDLSNCQNLQNLVIENISYETMIGNNVVNNIHRCYALQELNLDTLTFPTVTHLDLSSLKHLSKINIQNSRLTHVTINPSSLEEFWVYVKPELIQEIPSMKVSFVGGSQFSGSLHELSLVHVTMDVTLDLSNCQNLQNLVIDDNLI
ncbi:uncharacterized protein LOC128239125 isoform X2 [Mya arenaria]|uniref:uncharacterized protein LOC128239125 isoform X2 n=1 Tax=Mya arenaria TaxID=6604 RepID=UPI0022E94C69|nr:uncharacterized protein LOC128239125 isoform X2 [Mya arenaria]